MMCHATADWGWTPADVAAWNLAKSCAHDGFRALDTPQRPMEECPDCGAILRSITDGDGWASHWGEQRAEERAREDALLGERIGVWT